MTAHHLNTDEPQHLHVVWAWTRGFQPYRDLFDNHAPLFHLLFAPVFLALGERSDIVIWMRLTELPLVGLILWSTFEIGRTTFSPGVGLWAGTVSTLLPHCFLSSVEFRADNLWAALWLYGLAVLLRPRLSGRRSFLVGLAFGCALATSLKTLLLLATLIGSAFALVATSRATERRVCLEWLAARSVPFISGFAIVPLGWIAFFAATGTLDRFYECTILHNVLPGLGLWTSHPERQLIFPVAAPLLWIGAAWMRRASSVSSGIALRRCLVFVSAGAYLITLESFWPLLTAQDYLPFAPQATVLAIAALLAASDGLAVHWRRAVVGGALAATILLEIGEIYRIDHGREDLGAEASLIEEVLRLTAPEDFVLDVKGEAIYRRRPIYYALESITRERLRRGLIPDDIPERLIATSTTVAVADSNRFPPRARDFLLANYVAVGRLRVAGKFMADENGSDTRTLPFDLAIPGRYALVAERGPAVGSIDDAPYAGPLFLAPGRHVFRSAARPGRIALVWAPAVERGFLPF